MPVNPPCCDDSLPRPFPIPYRKISLDPCGNPCVCEARYAPRALLLFLWDSLLPGRTRQWERKTRQWNERKQAKCSDFLLKPVSPPEVAILVSPVISEGLLMSVEATHFPTTSLSWDSKGQREKVWMENSTDTPWWWIGMEPAY